jgi:hypothetical protein
VSQASRKLILLATSSGLVYMQVDESFKYICFTKHGKAVHKMLGNFGATFPISGKFFNYWQLFSIEQPLTLKTIN